MDTWPGRNSDPITLHKYLYANADPGNMVDPTGNFSMGSVMSSINIMSTLVSRAQTAITVFNIATGEEELSAKQLGSAILFNMMGSGAGKVIGLFGKKFANQFKKAGCPKNSFSSGTLVHAEDGLRSIEEIAIGDLVWSTNPETGERELKEVTHLIQGEQEYELFVIIFDNGDEITATAEHPFFANGEWINAKELNVGDVVQAIEEGGDVRIASIKVMARTERVFNLAINGFHTFHVGDSGYLVHNTNIFCSHKITAVFPDVAFKGLIKNKKLDNLTHNELYNAFTKTGYKPSSHSIMRMKDKRTKDLGFYTPGDLAKIFNKGEKFAAKGGAVGFKYKGLEAIVDPKTLVIITIKP